MFLFATDFSPMRKTFLCFGRVEERKEENYSSKIMSKREIQQKLFEKCQNGDLEDLADVLHRLAKTCGRRKDSVEFYKRSIEFNLTYNKDAKDLLFSSYLNLGEVLRANGDDEQAIVYLDRAVSMINEGFLDDPSKLCDCFIRIALAHRNRNQFQRAIEYLRETLKIQRRVLPENNFKLVETHLRLGSVYRSMKKYSKSIDFYEAALTLLQEHHEEEIGFLSYTQEKLSAVYFLVENFPSAVSCLKAAIELDEEIVPVDQSSLAKKYYNLSVIFEAFGKTKLSAKNAQKAVQIIENDDRPDRARLSRYRTLLKEVSESRT